jgi:predicted DNA-binding protein (MmcQ/YjbR family)
MNIEEFREYCLTLKGAAESFPFDKTTLVFKVGGKVFCLTDLEDKFSITVKNEPEKNVELREQYSIIKPAFHMNKSHWNMIDIDGTLSDNTIKDLIDESYDLVVQKLSKEEKQKLRSI